MTTTRDALTDLQAQWGTLYLITGAAEHWIAHRRDNGHLIVGASPAELGTLLADDQTECPVRPVRVLSDVS